MTDFQRLTLGDILTFQRGFDITKNEQSEGTVPIVSSSGISSYHNKWKVRGPGLVIGRKGTLGTVHYIRADFWPHDTTLWVKDFKGNSPIFLNYFLRTLKLENFDVGASNPTLNRNHLHKIKVIFPRTTTLQNRIAAILSAYDDSIDLNKRRIALLERMAEEIYREWFVRLRFPGHETATSVKGLPDGWRRRKMSDLARCKSGYTESALVDEALPKFLRVMDINKASFISWSAVPNCHISDVAFQKVKLTKNDVVIARMADPGKVAIVEQDVSAVFASYLIKLAYDPAKVTPYYLFYTLSSNAYADYFAGANSGATRGSINGTLIGNTQLVVPKREVLEQFESVIRPIREQLSNLVLESEMLAHTRDKILPRLVSGKLMVEHLAIEFPPSMADVNAEPATTGHA